MEGPGDRHAPRTGAADRAVLEDARQCLAGLLERDWSGRPLLTAVFQQLESCLLAGEQLEERQRNHLRQQLAASWCQRSEAVGRPRLAQLASRRRLLAEQQQQLDVLLAEARRQLQLAAAAPSDLPGRLLRKWERFHASDREDLAPEEAEGETQQQRQQLGVAAAPSPSAVKPWLMEGLSLEEACDKRRLLERCRQLDTERTRLQELRDTQYRPVTDYTHCLRKYFSCVQKTKHNTNDLMKARATLRLHSAWVRDHHSRLGKQSQRAPEAAPADPVEPTAELRHFDRQWSQGIEVATTAAGAGAGGASGSGAPPITERLLYSRLDAAESRALITEAAERGSWRQVEFALVHDRLTLTADCVVAMLVLCRCRGRCRCQWTRLAMAAQRRVPQRQPRARGWAWRKLKVATQLIRLLHSTKADG